MTDLSTEYIDNKFLEQADRWDRTIAAATKHLEKVAQQQRAELKEYLDAALDEQQEYFEEIRDELSLPARMSAIEKRLERLETTK